MEIAMISRTVGIALVSLVCLWPSRALIGAEQVRITHNQVFPPYAEVQEGKSVGLAVDIIRAAAARAGIDVVFVPLTIEQQMPALRDGRADATFSGVSPERQQFLDFSAPVIATGLRSMSACRMRHLKISRPYPVRSSSRRARVQSLPSSKRMHLP
jgi:ABC-type amino acid transport substrate-binding protein